MKEILLTSEISKSILSQAIDIWNGNLTTNYDELTGDIALGKELVLKKEDPYKDIDNQVISTLDKAYDDIEDIKEFSKDIDSLCALYRKDGFFHYANPENAFMTKLCSEIFGLGVYNTDLRIGLVQKAHKMIEKYRQEHLSEHLDYEKNKSKYPEALNNYLLFIKNLHENYCNGDRLEEFVITVCNSFYYSFIQREKFEISHFSYKKEQKLLICNYWIPRMEDIPNCKGFKKNGEFINYSKKDFERYYEDIIFSLSLKTINAIFSNDTKQFIKTIVLNGIVTRNSPLTGKLVNDTILSLMVKRKQMEEIEIEHIYPSGCFRYLGGVCSNQLTTMTPVEPIMKIDREDQRFIDEREIDLSEYTNLAAMDWEDFEHLVRQIFELEFSQNGCEVKITRSSRDFGVDAIAVDPDPIRGGKFVIQAKCYTNTVGVSAVRDLYGTVINEGANKGILVTTSSYGKESYEFARNKPLALLNGGHLLFLMEKHGMKARIDIQEAKQMKNI